MKRLQHPGNIPIPTCARGLSALRSWPRSVPAFRVDLPVLLHVSRLGCLLPGAGALSFLVAGGLLLEGLIISW